MRTVRIEKSHGRVKSIQVPESFDEYQKLTDGEKMALWKYQQDKPEEFKKEDFR